VFPCLVLNYAGQTALVLNGADTAGNIFYRLSPHLLLVPLVVLATVATVIASQSIITGAFSMTRQAIQLGWLPRLAITQTSAAGYGQIYVGPVNWLLMVVTLALTLGFKKSDDLAAAYGIAVSLTMLMTSVLLFIAMREIWRWSLPLAAAAAGALMVVDAGFVAANLMKVADGGYVPLLLAGVVYGVMLVWHTGAAAVAEKMREVVEPIAVVMQRVEEGGIARVPGTAVFMTRTERDAPPVMLWHLRHNRSLHRQVFILTVVTEPVPWVPMGRHMTTDEIAPGVWRGRAHFGFMERPDVPALLHRARDVHGCGVDLSDVTYFVGHETVVAREDKGGLPRWVESSLALLQRNSAHVTDYFRLPAETVVEIGREIAI
jgi:KUP system potassium uptake protein